MWDPFTKPYHAVRFIVHMPPRGAHRPAGPAVHTQCTCFPSSLPSAASATIRTPSCLASGHPNNTHSSRPYPCPFPRPTHPANPTTCPSWIVTHMSQSWFLPLPPSTGPASPTHPLVSSTPHSRSPTLASHALLCPCPTFPAPGPAPLTPPIARRPSTPHSRT